MDNAQKAIMIGVGLFITIIIIAAVMLITGMGQDMLSSGTKQITEISDNLSKQLYNDYDGKEGILGSEVISVIKTNYNKNGGIRMVVCENTGNKVFDTKPDAGEANKIGSVSSKVSVGAKYKCEVTLTDNRVTEMKFTKQP